MAPDDRPLVEFFFDYGSPFSYLANTQLPGIAARTGASIVYRPMLLGAVLKAISLRTGAKIIFSDGEAQAKLVSLDVTANTAEEGIRAAVSSAW